MMLMMIQTRDTTRYRFSCNQVQRTELQQSTSHKRCFLRILLSDILSSSVYCCQTFSPPQYIVVRHSLLLSILEQRTDFEHLKQLPLIRSQSPQDIILPQIFEIKKIRICRWTWIEETRSEYHHNHIQPFWDPLVCW